MVRTTRRRGFIVHPQSKDPTNLNPESPVLISVQVGAVTVPKLTTAQLGAVTIPKMTSANIGTVTVPKLYTAQKRSTT